MDFYTNFTIKINNTDYTMKKITNKYAIILDKKNYVQNLFPLRSNNDDIRKNIEIMSKLDNNLLSNLNNYKKDEVKINDVIFSG